MANRREASTSPLDLHRETKKLRMENQPNVFHSQKLDQQDNGLSEASLISMSERYVSAPDLNRTYEEEPDHKKNENSMLHEIIEALDTIKYHMEDVLAEETGVQKYKEMSNARETIYQNIIMLSSRSKQIELHNAKLIMELQLLRQEKKQEQQQQQQQQQQLQLRQQQQVQYPQPQQQQQQQQQQQHIPTNTYAQVAQKSYGEFPKRVSSNKSETHEAWRTPEKETAKNNEIFISTKNEVEMSDKWDNLRKTINPKDIDGGVKNVVKISKNKMLIQTESVDQKKKLLQILSKEKDIELKEENVSDPTIQISGVYGDITEEELKERLIHENEDLVNKFNVDTIHAGIKLLTKRQCRNETKYNFVLQVKPDIAKFLLKKEKVNINLVKHFVTEKIEVAICFLCCGYGHVQKYCGEKTETCHKCGQKHDSKICQQQLNCINCQKMGISSRSHSARDPECPCRIKKIQDRKKNINYQQ